jgi:hypothetical protein
MAELPSTQSGAWTLARARLAAKPERLLIEREPGRDALPVLSLAAGEVAVWDGRYRVGVGRGIEAAVEVRPLGIDGVHELRARTQVPPGLPVGSLRALPSFWRGGHLLAVPPVGFRSSADLADLAATFLPLASRSGAAG